MRACSSSGLPVPVRFRRHAGLTVAAALLTLTGCTRIQVWLGSRVRLEKLPIVSIEARQLGDPGIVPGQQVPLFVSVKGTYGKPEVTEGTGRGRVLWDDIHIAATVVEVNGKGIASLSPDPRISDGKTPHLVITVPSHPDLQAELDIPVRYDASFTADFSGRAGWGARTAVMAWMAPTAVPVPWTPTTPPPEVTARMGAAVPTERMGDPARMPQPYRFAWPSEPGAARSSRSVLPLRGGRTCSWWIRRVAL